ncbi:MAG: radical SAM protein [Candidatus Kapaibacterium sp.]
MEIIRKVGDENIANVFIAKINDKMLEFAESLEYPKSIYEKWVLTISCLYGCPVQCLMCDAGQNYYGKMSKNDMLSQIEHLVLRRFPDRNVPVEKFKIQFARMGEPVYNTAVLDVLEELPLLFNAPGLIPSISTIGPKNSTYFLDRLTEIKNNQYSNGKFQLQFSIHTTDIDKRNSLIPINKLTFKEISDFSDKFLQENDRKITLNFIVLDDYPIETKVISENFDYNKFIIKLTPLNPTFKANENGLKSKLDPLNNKSIVNLVEELKVLNFDTIVSIGNLEENNIGSNCGQYITLANNEKSNVN